MTAELRYMTDHVAMWVEQGVRMNQRELEASAERFEQKTYPTNREFFGSEWTPGVDNDVRLHILHSRGLGDTVAGYFSSADEYSRRSTSIQTSGRCSTCRRTLAMPSRTASFTTAAGARVPAHDPLGQRPQRGLLGQ